MGKGAPPGWVATMGPWGSVTAHTLEAVGEAPLHHPLRAEGPRGAQIPSLCCLLRADPEEAVGQGASVAFGSRVICTDVRGLWWGGHCSIHCTHQHKPGTMACPGECPVYRHLQPWVVQRPRVCRVLGGPPE